MGPSVGFASARRANYACDWWCGEIVRRTVYTGSQWHRECRWYESAYGMLGMSNNLVWIARFSCILFGICMQWWCNGGRGMNIVVDLTVSAFVNTVAELKVRHLTGRKLFTFPFICFDNLSLSVMTNSTILG